MNVKKCIRKALKAAKNELELAELERIVVGELVAAGQEACADPESVTPSGRCAQGEVVRTVGPMR